MDNDPIARILETDRAVTAARAKRDQDAEQARHDAAAKFWIDNRDALVVAAYYEGWLAKRLPTTKTV